MRFYISIATKVNINGDSFFFLLEQKERLKATIYIVTDSWKILITPNTSYFTIIPI